MPVFIETVEAALDAVQELALHLLAREHWQAAKAALWEAVDYPMDRAKLKAADKAFCAALEAEGWLNELKPM